MSCYALHAEEPRFKLQFHLSVKTKSNNSVRSHSCITASTFGGPQKCSDDGETRYSLILIEHHNTCELAQALNYTLPYTRGKALIAALSNLTSLHFLAIGNFKGT